MAYRLVTGVYPPPGVDFVVTEEDTQSFEPEPVPVETRVKLSHGLEDGSPAFRGRASSGDD